MRYTLEMPFLGSRRIKPLLNALGYPVGRKKVQSLMKKMGIEAIYPKPNLSKPHPDHIIYPYLLRNAEIIRANQVWGSDITYIRLSKGFAYLVAIMDWFSRYVISWELSTTLESCAVHRYNHPGSGRHRRSKRPLHRRPPAEGH